MKPFARPRAIAVSLRLLALFMVLNGVSVLVPEQWIDAGLVWCGVGHMPDAVLFRYLLRGAGLMLLAFGLLIWVIATDAVRFQPLVITVIVIFLIGAPAAYLIDSLVGLPWWWRLLDFTICLIGGGVPLLFWIWPSKGVA